MKLLIKTGLMTGWVLAALVGGSAAAATLIVGDQYDVTGSGSGFALGSGVNSGINPPSSRLTGTAAPGLRYIKAFGAKADSAHYITNSTKLGISRVASDSSTLSLSAGSGGYDFSSVLNSLAANPSQPAVYELTISIANAAAGSQRCSFALSSAAGTATTWDFALQLYRATTSDTAYTLQKRISAGASSGSAVNATIGTVGIYPNEIAFLIRVTDAGAESAAANSRVQVSLDGGNTWLYDTSTDPDLPAGWHFPGSSRFIYWDVAGGAGPVTFDDFSLTWISGPTAALRTWTGAGTDNNWSTGANWTGGAPGAGDALIFNGTSRLVNTNDLSALTVPWVTFRNGGFALYGNAFALGSAITNVAGSVLFGADLTWSSSAAKTWSLAPGSELLLNNNNTVEVSGDHTLLGGGGLRLKGSLNIGASTTANPAFILNEAQFIVDGGTFNSRGGFRIGSLATAATGALTVLTNGAVFTLTAAGANLRLGDSATPVTARLLINESTANLAGGSLAVPYAAGATAEVAQVGGLVAGCRLSFSDAGAGQGTYTLKNGALEPWVVRKNTAAGTAAISFENAVLRAQPGASNAFFGGLDLAEIKAGSLILDAQTDVVIAQNLTGSGSLIKSNSATVLLTGSNTYSGSTLVKEGKLVLPAGQTYAATIQVANSAELGVVVQTPGMTLTNSALTLGQGGSCSLSFDLGAFPNPSAPLVRVGTLSANGVVNISLANGLGLSRGRIVLVDYEGAIGGSGFAAFSLVGLPPGVSATLVNNTANTSLELNITAVPGFRWTGAINGEWDFATANWFSQQTGASSAYSDNFPIEFRDGAVTANINLSPFVTPTAITISNSTQPYLLNGGAITTSLVKKSGTATFTRAGGEADMIDELELNEGFFAVSNLFDASFATVLSDTGAGLGTFVKQGLSTLTVSGANSGYDGAILIAEGTLKPTSTNWFGTTNGTTTIASGATLDVNNLYLGDEPIVVSGAGVGGLGAILDSAAATGVQPALKDITMTGDTTLGSPNGGRWDIRVRPGTGPGPGLRGNGHKLIKVGSGSVSIACQRSLGADTPYWQMDLGEVVINEGSLAFAESLSLGNPSAGIVINPGAALQLYDLGLTNPILRDVTMTDARLTYGGASTHTNVLNGRLQLTGVNSINANQATLILNGAITGAGSLVFSATDPGTLVLNGLNTCTGDTVVSNGTLAGVGVIAGNLFIYGGTNAPGWAGPGTLTINGNVTLAGTTRLELDRSRSPNSDRLAVGGALTLGGTLEVVLGAGAPAPRAGDVYQLFSKGGSGAFAVLHLPDLSGFPGGLAWDTSKLAANGTLSVTGTATPPTISSVWAAGGDFVFSGTGGIEGDTYYVLMSTNLAAPLSWQAVATNLFGPGGTFTFTNPLSPAQPASFFRLELP